MSFRASPLELQNRAIAAAMPPSLRWAVEHLRLQVAKHVPDLHIDYGSTDEGQQWALLSSEHTPLATVAWGAGVPGVAAILAPDGREQFVAQSLGRITAAMRIAKRGAFVQAGLSASAV